MSLIVFTLSCPFRFQGRASALETLPLKEQVLLPLLTDSCEFLGLMGQFYPTIRIQTNLAAPFVNLPPPPHVPGLIRVCNLCEEFIASTDLCSLSWTAFPSGPSREPPNDFSIHSALQSASISQILGPLSEMQQNALLFPFECVQPAHGEHFQCFAALVVQQIASTPEKHCQSDGLVQVA